MLSGARADQLTIADGGTLSVAGGVSGAVAAVTDSGKTQTAFYETLARAVDAAGDGADVSIIKAGDHTLPAKAISNITIAGVDGTVMTCEHSDAEGSNKYTNVTIENVKFAKSRWNASFTGENRIENCTFAAENEYAFRYAYVVAGGSLSIEDCVFDEDCEVYVHYNAASNVTVTLTGCSVSDGSAVKDICYEYEYYYSGADKVEEPSNRGWKLLVDNEKYDTGSGLKNKF